MPADRPSLRSERESALARTMRVMVGSGSGSRSRSSCGVMFVVAAAAAALFLREAQAWGPPAMPMLRMSAASTAGTRRLPPPRCKASTREEYFTKLGEGKVKFGGVQDVHAALPQASPADLQEYLYGQPDRIIYACWDNKYLEYLEEQGVYRIYLKSFEFLSLKLDFSIDLRIWAEDGWVKVKSLAWSAEELERLLGQNFVDTFSLDVTGRLKAMEQETVVRGIKLTNPALAGEIDVGISGQMPPLLQSFPDAIVKSAALGINQRVIDYAVNIFFNSIDADFRRWAQE